jgi:Protein of unknown function (DUF3300)
MPSCTDFECRGLTMKLRFTPNNPSFLDSVHAFVRDTRRMSRSAATSVLRCGRTGIVISLISTIIPFGVESVDAQQPPPPPPPQYLQLDYTQLGQLVAPIALYPDALVAQILAGATYPIQIVEADRLVQANIGLPPEERARIADTQQWDPSVKALTAFPSVLSNMSGNLDWTSKLGNAYYNQPQDVMTAVQTMRQRAYEAGTLRSTPQLSVRYQPGYTVIQPVNPAVVYVPVYNPWVVYGALVPVYPAYYYVAPPPPAGGIVVAAAIGFTAGIVVGAFGSYGWGYTHWSPNWYSHTVVYNNVTYVSRSVTVVNHGYYGYYDHSPSARAYNHQVAYGPNGYVGSRTASTVNGHTNVALNGPNGTATRSTTHFAGGNTTTVTAPNGHSATRTITGIGSGNVNATTVGPNGGVTTRNTQSFAGGNTTTVTKANGQTASRTINGLGTNNVTATTTGPNGGTTTRNTQSFAGGNSTTVTKPDGQTASRTINGLGTNNVTATTTGTNGRTTTRNTQSFAGGNSTTVTKPDRQTASRTVTGIGTGNVNATSTVPNGGTVDRQTTSGPKGSSTTVTKTNSTGQSKSGTWKANKGH